MILGWTNMAMTLLFLLFVLVTCEGIKTPLSVESVTCKLKKNFIYLTVNYIPGDVDPATVKMQYQMSLTSWFPTGNSPTEFASCIRVNSKAMSVISCKTMNIFDMNQYKVDLTYGLQVTPLIKSFRPMQYRSKCMAGPMGGQTGVQTGGQTGVQTGGSKFGGGGMVPSCGVTGCVAKGHLGSNNVVHDEYTAYYAAFGSIFGILVIVIAVIVWRKRKPRYAMNTGNQTSYAAFKNVDTNFQRDSEEIVFV